jgi:hypothetical protein
VLVRIFVALLLVLQISPVLAAENPETSIAAPQNRQIDFKHLLVFSAGLHKFDKNYLHPGVEAVVGVDIDLMKVMSARGVPDDHMVFFRDEEATRDNCRNGLHQLIAKANTDDVLFFFIHSHGGDGVICTYQQKEGWQYQDLIQEIEQNFRGRTAVICIAACHSGSFIDVMKSAPRRVSYFVLTTVHPDKNAWTIATSDFEACVADAFSGAPCPDLNQDGVTTFEEFAQYVSRDQSTLFGSQPDFAFSNGFDKNMVLSNAAPRTGRWQCCLVRTDAGFRGRVMRQEGDRLLFRPRKFPERLYATSPNRVRLLD